MSDEIPEGNVQHWVLRMEASGSVHDADGNLLNQDVKASGTVTLTDAEARAFIERQGS